MDNNEVYKLVKDADDHNGFIWMKPIWNNNTYTLASDTSFKAEWGLDTISDLALVFRNKQGKIKTSVGSPFAMRPDGLPGLSEHYEFKIDEEYLIIGEPGRAKDDLKNNICDIAIVFGTDAEIAKYYWFIYKDNKAFFPPYDLTPYVRKEALDKYPEIANILGDLIVTFPGGGGSANLNIVAEGQRIWQELNAMVDIDKRKPEEVAHEYLIKHGLIKE
jgi:osmoprotectant transport system substrate-binding protein